MRTLLFAVITVIHLSIVGAAASFTSVVVYGDSLSDNGNLFQLTGYPPAPYCQGPFSNGPVAVEHLAQKWGATLNDYAVAGATTGLGNFADGGTATMSNGVPGMMTMFQAYNNPATVSANSLYVIWGGLMISSHLRQAIRPLPTCPWRITKVAQTCWILRY